MDYAPEHQWVWSLPDGIILRDLIWVLILPALAANTAVSNLETLEMDGDIDVALSPLPAAPHGS